MCWRQGMGHLGALSWMHKLGDTASFRMEGPKQGGWCLLCHRLPGSLGESLDVAVPVAGFS